MERENQTQLILRHLSSGKAITPLEALEKFGCLRLGGRIYELRQRGYAISTTLIPLGENKRVAQYKLAA